LRSTTRQDPLGISRRSTHSRQTPTVGSKKKFLTALMRPYTQRPIVTPIAIVLSARRMLSRLMTALLPLGEAGKYAERVLNVLNLAVIHVGAVRDAAGDRGRHWKRLRPRPVDGHFAEAVWRAYVSIGTRQSAPGLSNQRGHRKPRHRRIKLVTRSFRPPGLRP
jgi:hypothetical protein